MRLEELNCILNNRGNRSSSSELRRELLKKKWKFKEIIKLTFEKIHNKIKVK